MLKDMCIQMLREVAEKNEFSPTQMAYLLGISTEQYRKWMKGKHFTRSHNTLRQIEKVIKEYHPKAG